MKTHSNNLVVLAHVQLKPFYVYRLSTRDVTHVRKCTRPSPAFPYYKRRKAGRGLGTRLGQCHCAVGSKSLCCQVNVTVYSIRIGPHERAYDDEFGTDGIERGYLCKWLLVMVLLGAIEGSQYAGYNTSGPVYSWVASASCLKSPDGHEYDLKDTSTESVREFVRRGRKLVLFVYPDGMVLDQVVITVGAIAESSYAIYNKLCPVYSWVPGRKAGGQNLKSPLGYTYNLKVHLSRPQTFVCADAGTMRGKSTKMKSAIKLYPFTRMEWCWTE